MMLEALRTQLSGPLSAADLFGDLALSHVRTGLHCPDMIAADPLLELGWLRYSLRNAECELELLRSKLVALRDTLNLYAPESLS